MKRNRLFSAFSDIDQRYIEEARPKNKKKKNKFIRRLAFVAVLVLMFSWLFFPISNNPDKKIAKYKSSEYYPVISSLNTYIYSSSPKYKNNFDKISSMLVGCGRKVDMAPGMDYDDAVSNGASPEGSYEETTDNQVAGVIEADLIKRTSTHFYYLDKTTVKVYSIRGENSALVNTFDIPSPENAQYIWMDTLEFYLSLDAKRLTVIYPYTHSEMGTAYDIISLNVEDPHNITQTNRISVIGSYLSSRLVNDTLLVVGSFMTNTYPEYENPETFVPSYDSGDGLVCLPMEDIIVPEQVSNRRYTVLTKFDETTLTLQDTIAVLSYSDILYVSNETVYLTTSYRDVLEFENKNYTITKTDILSIDYAGEEFEEKGSVTVNGSLKDQYSLDEYEGKLRCVTTTSGGIVPSQSTGTALDDGKPNVFTSSSSASLYIIDKETMSTLAKVENFAPLGEMVRSVRFDGDYAYVCTAIQITDPVFFFDLSDVENITYKDTGNISGFSTSLIQLGNGFLLGIGVGDGWNSVKVEVYEESENGVVSVAKYEIKDANYTSEYKTYLIDRENGLFGFGVTGYTQKGPYGYYYGNSYIVLHFDGYELRELVTVELPASYASRAIHIDGYIYFFGENAFAVRPLTVEDDNP